MSKVTQPVSIKDLINATLSKKVSSRIILEIEGCYYQAASVEPVSGNLVIIHAKTPIGIDWGLKERLRESHGRVPKALEQVSLNRKEINE